MLECFEDMLSGKLPVAPPSSSRCPTLGMTSGGSMAYRVPPSEFLKVLVEGNTTRVGALHAVMQVCMLRSCDIWVTASAKCILRGGALKTCHRVVVCVLRVQMFETVQRPRDATRKVCTQDMVVDPLLAAPSRRLTALPH